MEGFLNYVIKELVEFPDEVVITTTEVGDSVTYHVAMRKSDLGKIIGRGGHTIQALRTLLQVAEQKRGMKANLEIIE